MGNDKHLYFNGSGYKDPTAYEALKAESARERSEKARLTHLIDCLKYIIGLSGFELVGRIHLRDKESGKEYR